MQYQKIEDSKEQQVYQTLDKDYGRTKYTGSGYGELDSDQYKALEELLK